MDFVVLAGILLLLPIVAALQIARWVRASWTIANATKGTRNLERVGSAHLANGLLTLRGVRGVEGGVLSIKPRRVVTYHLEGDGGFADANSESYVFIAETADHGRLSWSSSFQGNADFEALNNLFAAMREAEVLEAQHMLRGAIGGGLIMLFLPIWFAVAAFVWAIARHLW